jgi:hypothetical protein
LEHVLFEILTIFFAGNADENIFGGIYFIGSLCGRDTHEE